MSDDLTISIRAPGDKKLPITISPDKSVRELKQAVTEALAAASPPDECPPERQRLIFSGRVLKDEDVLSKYKLANGHTIHLVKSAPPQDAPAAAAQVPQNMGAGQTVANNPLAILNRGDVTGFAGFNPFAGMDINQNDPNLNANMMNSPAVQQQLSELMNNPAVIDQIIASSPELQAMGPQARQIMQSPMFRQMMTNPQVMRQAQAAMGRGGGGAGGAQPGLFGLAQAAQAGGAAGAGAGAGGAAPDLSTLFGPGSPFGQLGGGAAGAGGGSGALGGGGDMAQQMAALQQMLAAGGGPGFGGAGAGPDTRSPEERYATELEQLRNMGFGNARQNVRAILAAGGDVDMAIAYLLEGDAPAPGN